MSRHLKLSWITKILLAAGFLLGTQLFGYNPEKCFNFTSKDGLRKYDFPGFLSKEYMTKKYGTSGSSTESSSQSSTRSFDPIVSTNQIISTSDFTTSNGPCSYYSQRMLLKDQYLASNGEEFEQQTAMAHGEHLKAYFYLSGCEASSFNEFRKTAQNSYGELAIPVQDNAKNFRAVFDQSLLSNPNLASKCSFLSSIPG